VAGSAEIRNLSRSRLHGGQYERTAIEGSGTDGQMTIPGFFQGSEMPDARWWQVLWPSPAKVVADVALSAGMTAVDLCCGDGWFTLPIAQIARHVTAIDIDAALLQIARERVAENGIANCTFIEADASAIGEIILNPADHVFLANVFHGVPERSRLARSVHDALRPGGLFAVVNWHAKPREETIVLGERRGPATELRMTPEQTIASVEKGGLSFWKQVEVSPYHYATIFERKPRCGRDP
jgi:2-polyprenyl-3-methyl-5-hydroxy-6-metoxy-1,4-benzoquinol methylase